MGEIRALTSLRGLAAMMVVMQHFSATVQQHAVVSIPSLVPHGYMAVDLFFVLSGFIMAYTYQADFALRGMRAMPDFLMKRAARVLPLSTAVVLAIVLAALGSKMMFGTTLFPTSTNLLSDALCNILLLQGLGIGLNLNGPSWSISTEFTAYLIFPAFLAVVFARRLIIVLLTLGLACGALGILAFNHQRLGLDTGSVEGALTRCFAEFVIGLCTYRLTRMASMQRLLTTDWLAGLTGLWIGVMLCLRVDLLAAMGFPVIVAALACNDGKIKRLMANKTLYFLGEISFSIYLLHDPLRTPALAVLRYFHPSAVGIVAALGFALLSSLLVILPAWAAHVTIERPGRRIIRTLGINIMTQFRATGRIKPWRAMFTWLFAWPHRLLTLHRAWYPAAARAPDTGQWNPDWNAIPAVRVTHAVHSQTSRISGTSVS